MGMQKYRADRAEEKQANGATPYYTEWIGGPTLALVRDCPIVGGKIAPRTVYVLGEPDTYFSIPAACTYRRKVIRGFLSTGDNGQWIFTPYAEQP